MWTYADTNAELATKNPLLPRYFIIYHLPNLRFLDSNPITDQERDEALKRCYWMESSGLGVNNNNNSSQQADLVASLARAQNGNHANGIGARVQLTSPAAAAYGQQPAEGYRLEGARRAAPDNSLEPRGQWNQRDRLPDGSRQGVR